MSAAEVTGVPPAEPLWKRLLPPAALLVIIFFGNLPFAHLGLMSPDASGYLDMGRNLISGKGAVTSYDLYQFWPERYHPFPPYMQPAYPVVAGITFALFGLTAVVGLNILLFAVNCVLLYFLLARTTDRFTAFLIALYMGFDQPLVFSAVFPWTEQLHLLLIFSAVLLYLRGARWDLLCGVLLALSCLARAASLYNVAAFALAMVLLGGFSSASWKRYAITLAGFVAVFGSYEAFCVLHYGILYPQYLPAAKAYTIGIVYPGASYRAGFPVLHVPRLSLALGTQATNVFYHLMDIGEMFGAAAFTILLAPLAVIFSEKRRRDGVFVILLLQGLVLMVCYSLNLAWMPSIEGMRYALIPIMTIAGVGIVVTRQLAAPFIAKLEGRLRPVTIAFFAVLFFFSLGQYAPFRHYYLNDYQDVVAANEKARDEVYAWIRANAPPDALVASDHLGDAFFFERPFVALPSGRALTQKNIDDFVAAFRPEYVLTSDKALADYLRTKGFTGAASSDMLVLLRRPS